MRGNTARSCNENSCNYRKCIYFIVPKKPSLMKSGEKTHHGTKSVLGGPIITGCVKTEKHRDKTEKNREHLNLPITLDSLALPLLVSFPHS